MNGKNIKEEIESLRRLIHDGYYEFGSLGVCNYHILYKMTKILESIYDIQSIEEGNPYESENNN